MERSSSLTTTRRRALAVLGAGTVVGGAPGVSASDVDPLVPPDPPVDFDGYPYGHDEADVESAKRVMEEAGYGPDERYQLELIFLGGPHRDVVNTVHSHIEEAYIDLKPVAGNITGYTSALEDGKYGAYVLGYYGLYPAPQPFLQKLYPPNTLEFPDGDSEGAYVFWSAEANGDPDVRTYASDQFETLANNPGTTERARRKRAGAALAMEEANWEEVVLLPLYHQTNKYLWHDWVDYEVPGAMGSSKAKTSDTVVALEARERLPAASEIVSGPLDPVASGETASDDVIADLYEGLFEFPNGETEVDTVLAKEFAVSDDATTYTVELKEGVAFHDGTELTAADVVYSFRRLLESPNSRLGYVAKEVLGLVHETESVENDEGEQVEQVVPDSLGVTSTAEYEIEIELEAPFPHAPSVLARPAFSIVPEGIVGDVEGYDGEMSYDTFANENPVGTGPFELVEREQQGYGSKLVLDTADEYHGEAPNYEGVDRIYLSSEGTFERFVAGEVATSDAVYDQLDPELISIDRTDDRGRRVGTYGPLENGETVNYAKVPEIVTTYLGFNLEKVPKPVRQAVAYVVNQREINREVFDGRSVPAYHLMPPQVFPGGADAYENHYEPGSDVDVGTRTPKPTGTAVPNTETGSSKTGTRGDDGQGMPGFGIGTGLAALGGGALLRRLRGTDED